MRKKFIAYLHNPRHIEQLALGLLAFILMAVLFFSPYRIHDWIEQYRISLMWLDIALLVAVIIVLVKEISELKEQNEQLSEDAKLDQKELTERYNFYDEKGDLKLSVNAQMLYYLEGADNYVEIHYMCDGKLSKMLIRNSLRNLEWRYREQGLVRCHRSYIVNLNVVKLLKRSDGELSLDFGDDRIKSIPVSKGYANTILDLFTNK